MVEKRDRFWSIHQSGNGDVKKEPKDEHDDQNRPDKIFFVNLVYDFPNC